MKSKDKYISVYETFTNWKNTKNIVILSEDVILAYFEELATKYKRTTLWTIYSMLKCTLKARDSVDIKNYNRLTEYLKIVSKGYVQATKTKNLTTEQIQKFLDEAPDEDYLAKKVILIFGVAGGCRRRELTQLQMEDIHDHGKMFEVKITNQGTNIIRKFTIHGQFYKIVKKYMLLRKPCTKHDRFFQNYQKGKCTMQPIGINKVGAVIRDIAIYLGLPDPDAYSGHSMKKTFSSLLKDVKGSHLLYDVDD